MVAAPSLGSLDIDLPRLLETRMLVQSNSGGGKSFALRRILEQTAPSVQQLVIDPEGEFPTLREKFDYIVCAPQGADAIASPHTAAALARALWESGASAILDVYELKAHDRILFVRRFCEALVNAPRRIWHPTLVVIDEIHIFAPQVGNAESFGAVIDLATRGRKRGLALVGATQRLSKLNKDVAAELLNKLIGRTGLDVDVNRAADELGMTKALATETLRNLEPGEFFAYGPALSRTVERTTIGPVQTTHPKIGERAMTAPPPASKAIVAKLQKIEGIQREAVEEAHDIELLKKVNAQLKRELDAAEKRAKQAGVPEAEVQRREKVALQTGRSEAKIAPATLASDHTKALEQIASVVARALGAQPTSNRAQPRTESLSRRASAAPPPGSITGIRAGAVRILQELAARAPAGYTKPQVGGLTGFSHKGGTFNTYLGDLRRGAFIEERSGMLYATEHGITSLGSSVPAKPTSHADAMAMWRKALRAGAHQMLEVIVASGSEEIHKGAIADAVGMTASGGTFNTYLGDLRRNGLVTESNGIYRANDILFPDRRAA